MRHRKGSACGSRILNTNLKWHLPTASSTLSWIPCFDDKCGIYVPLFLDREGYWWYTAAVSPILFLRGLCRTLCAELERESKMATLEELINRMYDMVQDAKGIPLAGEKCIVERDHMLDMLDELREALPNDLQQAQEIVAKRSEMLASGKREAEAIRRQAEEDARQMVSETEIVVAARRKAKGSTGQCRDSGS